MTRPAQDTPDLAVVIKGQMPRWIPPFVACVVGDPEVAAVLGPALHPVTGHISGGAHFYRTVAPFAQAYLNPGDGSFAAPLRDAHTTSGVTTDQLTAAVSWQLTLACSAAESAGYGHLVPALEEAAQTVADVFGANPDGVWNSVQALHAHFRGIIVPPHMVDGFWEVLAFSKIAAALGNPTNTEVIMTCREYLPTEFIDQFARD